MFVALFLYRHNLCNSLLSSNYFDFFTSPDDPEHGRKILLGFLNKDALHGQQLTFATPRRQEPMPSCSYRDCSGSKAAQEPEVSAEFQREIRSSSEPRSSQQNCGFRTQCSTPA